MVLIGMWHQVSLDNFEAKKEDENINVNNEKSNICAYFYKVVSILRNGFLFKTQFSLP